MKGKLITFEGIDGVGKTTVIKSLSEILKDTLGDNLITTYTPGATPIGQKIKKILLDGEKDDFSIETKTSLFLYDHLLHIQEVLIPALAKGKIILCDRYIDSLVVYQNFGYGVNLDCLSLLMIPVPTKTFLLECPMNIILNRLKRRKISQFKDNWLDSMDLDFYEKINEGYSFLAKKHSNRIKKINANVPDNVLLKTLLKECENLF